MTGKLSVAAEAALRETDWEKLDAMTDEDITRQIEENPDAAPNMAPELDVRAIRRRSGMTQEEFAGAFGIPVRTLQGWERHGTVPSGPAKTLLQVIDREPAAVRRALKAA